MKYYTKYIILFISFLFVCLEDRAQSLSILNTDLQKVRVGLVDEFFDRFNGKIAHPDIPLIDNDSRKKNLMVLMDLNQFSSKNDSLFQEALNMMDAVINDSVKINYSDTTWYAIAHCKAFLERKSINLDLYLTVQHRKENMYKWVISKVEGDIFEISPQNEKEKIMLSPGDHETYFMSLGRMTKEQPFNVKNFMAKSFEYDMTSVFAYLVYSRKLKIDYVYELEFVFTQVPGYIFHLNYFERESKNSGWLISRFYKSTKEYKASFLGRLYSQNVVELSNEEAVEIDNCRIGAEEIDTVVVENVDQKPRFVKRRAEKIVQLLDYINFMQHKDSLRSLSMYQAKTEALFSDSAKVHLRYKKKSKNCIVDIPTFCGLLIKNEIKFERIDSICIPLWNDTINSLQNGTNKVELASSLLSFAAASRDIQEEKSNLPLKLYAYKEETEDGIEWISIIGDIIVKVK